MREFWIARDSEEKGGKVTIFDRKPVEMTRGSFEVDMKTNLEGFSYALVGDSFLRLSVTYEESPVRFVDVVSF